MWKLIRPYLRGGYRLLNGLRGFIYDFGRFCKYSGWNGSLDDFEHRNYNAAMVYHGLEKSLSYKKRSPNSGWRNALELKDMVIKANLTQRAGYHDKAAKVVLDDFLGLPENAENDKRLLIESGLQDIQFESPDKHGALEYSGMNFKRGILKDPESFFLSRYSLREFKEEIVPKTIIERAVRLAMKTPSVCNRQPWAVYHTSESDVKKLALGFQSGNRPFGDKIPNLMVVTTDLKAFFAGSEHYQHWIDGGLFSMSVIYALHALGVASCALNWSQDPKVDRDLRKALNIKPNHTIIMMIAIGYPDEQNRVCASARRPLNEVYFDLEKRT